MSIKGKAASVIEAAQGFGRACIDYPGASLGKKADGGDCSSTLPLMRQGM